MSDRVVYLMRGLPACGKSFTARKLAGESGVVCETDEYFYTQVGDDPRRYDYRADLLPQARQWCFERYRQALKDGRSPVVVDRGNGRNLETQQFARCAVEHGYRLELAEPESEWWQEIRVLLKYKEHTREVLYKWADTLAAKSQATHRVPAATIRHWMDHWHSGLTVEEIINYTHPNE